MEIWSRSWLGLNRKVVTGLFAVALMSGTGALAAPPEKLAITAATWKTEKAELKVEGIARKVDGVVLVRDAQTKKLLGSAAVRGDGKWMLKIRDPSVVPSKMRAELEGNCVECVVQVATDASTAVAVQADVRPEQ